MLEGEGLMIGVRRRYAFPSAIIRPLYGMGTLPPAPTGVEVEHGGEENGTHDESYHGSDFLQASA
jgi:hypothetical protein